MITGAIPLPGDPGQAFEQAFNGMDDFFQKIKQHQLEQQKLQELMRHQQVAEQLSRAAAGRAERAASLAERKEQPGYRVQKFLQEREMLRKALANRFPNMPGVNNGMLQNSGGQMSEEQPQELSYGMGQGMMMPGGQMSGMMQGQQPQQPMMPETAQQPEMPVNNQQLQPQVDAYGIDWNNPVDAMAAQNAGFKKPVETPAQKSARVIAEKKAEEDYKNSQAAYNAQQKAEGKYQGETYGQAVDTAMGLGDIGHNLDYLVQRVEENPDAKNVIGPVNQFLTKLSGSKEDQEFLGQIMSGTGNIVLDAAKGIKGAFTGRDQTLINSMKPNASDPYYVFVGKLRAMQELTHLAQERANIYADEVHKGTAPHRAIEIARNQTNMAEEGRRAEKQVQMARYKSDLQLGINPKFKTQEEKTEFLNSLSAKEKIQLLKTMGA